MSSPTDTTSPNTETKPAVGPHPSFIQVAQPYIFEQDIRDALDKIRITEARDLQLRLPGVNWIESVRKAMQLPVKTFNTACVYYHKFRLVHADNEYTWQDASIAALFAACKIEDTLKKSRDILCAAHNLRQQQMNKVPLDNLTPDDPSFEIPVKKTLGLERLMLESSGFDFRSRHPQTLVIKLAKFLELADKPVPPAAYNVCCDLYRTWAPLKQSTPTMAIASLELAARLLKIDVEKVCGHNGPDYSKWGTSRENIMETLLDLLDLYDKQTRNASLVGSQHDLNDFINIRIDLNNEATANNYPRYTEEIPGPARNGKPSPRDPLTGLEAPSSVRSSDGDFMKSPETPGSVTKVLDRGREGTVRFMLDPERATRENDIVDEYYTMVEVDDDDDRGDMPR